jgi:hypothetical protein
VRLTELELPGDRVTPVELRAAFRPGDAMMVNETIPVSKMLGKPFFDVAVVVAVAAV